MRDVRRLGAAATFLAGLLLVALAVAFFRTSTDAVWLIVGALFAGVLMLRVIHRLRRVAQEWGKELRLARSELKAERNRRAKEEALYQALVQGIPIPFFLCQTNGVILHSSQKAKEHFQFQHPEGRTLLEVTLCAPLHHAVLHIQPGTTLTQSFSLSHPEESHFNVTIWRTQTEPETVFVAMVNETELRRLRTVRSDFVANVSHELRTPMAALRAMTQTLLDDPELTEDEKKQFLEKIIAEVDRLTALSEDLLTLALAESKPAEKKPVDLAKVVASVAQQFLPQIQARGLRLNLSLPQTLLIAGDEPQLIQVVVNLLSNAVRYTEQGEISVTLTSQNGFAVLEVRDTGIGIASEHLPRIFERFYRVDRARSRASGGTGLGLSIVRHIVEAHSGTIEVESKLHEGSTFRVRLPLS
jgi:two-component system phosphate regulon sensor histidine kinase PhoR